MIYQDIFIIFFPLWLEFLTNYFSFSHVFFCFWRGKDLFFCSYFSYVLLHSKGRKEEGNSFVSLDEILV